MLPWWLMLASVIIAAGALLMTLINLSLYGRRAMRPAGGNAPRATLSVCIPARNEEANIEACVRSVLAATEGVETVVLVYDDQSTDATPTILARLGAQDPRVRTVATSPLPTGWVGKQWACDVLGRAAATDWVLFIDADVRLAPGCLAASLDAASRLKADLLSTFPRQITGSLAEKLVVPLIHFILFSYLPFARMRTSKDPSASAACGQFILTRRSSYLASGGHAAFKDSMHDGVKMPRAFRRTGFHTDLFDGTGLCECRMYRGLGATWRGFAKNAYEGLGSIGLLVFITVMHAVGHVLPWVELMGAAVRGSFVLPTTALAAAAVGIALAQRFILARRFEQSLLGAALHPVGVVLMTLIQWHSLILAKTGRRGWRGRALAPTPAGAQQ
jgi:hypothetical protein